MVVMWIGLGILGTSCSQKTTDENAADLPLISKTESFAVSEEVDVTRAIAGKILFDKHCIACHAMDKQVIGPALGDVASIRSSSWLTDMISEPDSMLKHDPIARQLLKEFNNIRMTPSVTREEALSLVEFLKETYQLSI
jgi:hypothetical protein